MTLERADVVDAIARLPVDREFRRAQAEAWEIFTGQRFDPWELSVIDAGLRSEDRAAS